MRRWWEPRAVGRAAASGVVAAMAMTGMRRVTTGLGLVERTPPDTIAEQGPLASRLVHRLPAHARGEAIEIAHWTYGALGGVLFGALPAALRRRAWAGPAYGLAVWLVFEAGLVPLLGLHHVGQKQVVARAAIAADHVLYGTVVATSGGRREA